VRLDRRGEKGKKRTPSSEGRKSEKKRKRPWLNPQQGGQEKEVQKPEKGKGGFYLPEGEILMPSLGGGKERV